MVTDEAMDIEEELIDHLAVPESAMILYREQVGVDLLLSDETGARRLLPFVLDYIEKYGKGPEASQIIHEMGGHFSEPESPVEWVVDKLKTRYERNRAKDIVSRLASLAVSDPHEAVRYGLEQFSEVSRQTSSHDGVLTTADWDRAISLYNNRVLSGTMRGLSFGFSEMDDVIGGMRPGTMSFICGRPKSAKSFCLLKAAVANVLAGHKVHFETMELREDEMYGRFQCMVAGMSYSKYFRGTLSLDEIEEMRRIGKLLKESAGEIRFVHSAPDERTVRHIHERASEWDPDIVEIDQFSFITPTSKAQAKHERDSATVYEIKNILTPHYPVYVAAQFNRAAASLTEMADLAQIGLTDAIGQASDIVLGLFSNKEMRESKIIQIGTIATRASEGVTGLISNRIGVDGDLKWIERV